MLRKQPDGVVGGLPDAAVDPDFAVAGSSPAGAKLAQGDADRAGDRPGGHVRRRPDIQRQRSVAGRLPPFHSGQWPMLTSPRRALAATKPAMFTGSLAAPYCGA